MLREANSFSLLAEVCSESLLVGGGGFGVVLDVVPFMLLYHVQVQHSTLATLDMSDAFRVNC